MPVFDVTIAVQEHFARIHRAALVLTGNVWDADDLAQETFLVAADQRTQFAGRSQLYTWLYGILLNLERKRRRRRDLGRRKLRLLWGNRAIEKPTASDAAAPAEAREWRESLWREVAALPDGQRQALVLRFSEHLAYEEIATVLECPLGTVKSRIFNGLATLRATLSTEKLAAILPDSNEELGHVI
jgi:RNA polymerase sigma-70 factor (ECF subfamily)